MRYLPARKVLAGAVTLLGGASAATAIALPVAAATGTLPRPLSAVYVATHGTAKNHDRDCDSAGYSSVQAAVSAVKAGGLVVVCGGTYHEDVTIAKPLSLTGVRGAVIDAAGRDNGILVTASHVQIKGFTITGAIGEGILVKSAKSVTIEHNAVVGNDQGEPPAEIVPITYGECLPQGGVPGDCGEGIHLMGSSFSTVADNVVTGNSGGILLSDETGPASHDKVAENVVADNLADCGITVVGHNPGAAPNGKPVPKTAGVYANVISGNTLSGNGTKGQGAGVVLASGLPGGAVYDNTVDHNTISGNGIAGVTVHSHVPGQFLNGNLVTDNLITVNNLDGDNDFAPHVDDQTTGVLIATVSALRIEVTGNEIVGDHFGIWSTGPVTDSHAGENAFAGDSVPIARG